MTEDVGSPFDGPFDLDELRARIEQLDGGVWRVERTLRSTPYEETQLVYRRDSGVGPFVRKLFADDAGRGGAYETLFRAQAAGSRLEHIPLVYDCTRTDDGLAVVMEYVRGETLFECVRREGPGERLARNVAPALLDALDELHTVPGGPLVHRDVKPENVMLGERRLVLVDLGIARVWHAGADRDTTLFGTPGYAPPEQYGFGQTGVTGDIYSAGMTIAFCCTGEAPSATLRESGFADPRIPGWLRPVLVRATQLDPAARFRSAAEMRDALGMLRRQSSDPHAPFEVGRPDSASPEGSAGAAPRARTDGHPVPDARAAGRMGQDEPAAARIVRLGKYVWNACIVFMYLFLIYRFVTMTKQLIDERSEWPSEVLDEPVGRMVLAIDALLLVGMLTVGAYLLLFKVHLRRVKPFSQLTWRSELPLGIGLIVLGAMLMSLLATFYSVVSTGVS